MNERIRELAVEAGYKPLPGFDFANSLEEVFLKKFAHLIVQECANLLVKEAKSSHDEGSETYDTLIRESNWMKHYFGVE